MLLKGEFLFLSIKKNKKVETTAIQWIMEIKCLKCRIDYIVTKIKFTGGNLRLYKVRFKTFV